MKKFKVIALYCPNGSNRVFNSGDEVTEADFADGVWAEKLNRGFLELIGETEPPKQDPPPADDALKGDTDLTVFTEKTGTEEEDKSGTEGPATDLAETLQKTLEGTSEASTEKTGENVPHGTSKAGPEKSQEITVKIDDIDIKQIRKDLKKSKITFDEDAPKEILFELWQKRELTETI